MLLDNDYVVVLISEATSRPPGEVRRRLGREHAQPGVNVCEAMRKWNLEPHVWSDRLARFYDSTDAFLFESIVWNRTATKQAMRDWIVAFVNRPTGGPRRILTYGDGLGFDSLSLAKAGHHVSYFEVSPSCIRFARRIFSDCGVCVEILTSQQEIQPGSYDAAVCLDVLEHLPEPLTMVCVLAGALRPGGHFLVHAPFWHLQPSVGTHLQANLRYSGDYRRLYEANGLRPIDGRLFWNPLVLEKTSHETPRTRIRLSTWARVHLGGCLLRLARYWICPYRWIFRAFAARDRAGLLKQWR
jgi:SAM-dependent methyltransferase